MPPSQLFYILAFPSNGIGPWFVFPISVLRQGLLINPRSLVHPYASSHTLQLSTSVSASHRYKTYPLFSSPTNYQLFYFSLTFHGHRDPVPPGLVTYNDRQRSCGRGQQMFGDIIAFLCLLQGELPPLSWQS
ncbi:hypothetical protein PDE_05281 [Penicillium oxalicum 114-2]|uniref:Uncharacterized protein n=1 Tax=Penicillium oxalicum (strain 114-2 / CGMCC 5302) TaxID=933388 RepID=S7ZI85_PENO1|nr:hypothetical protein PDE_05281 [Penicillium oxalicum 114-2]